MRLFHGGRFRRESRYRRSATPPRGCRCRRRLCRTGVRPDPGLILNGPGLGFSEGTFEFYYRFFFIFMKSIVVFGLSFLVSFLFKNKETSLAFFMPKCQSDEM